MLIRCRPSRASLAIAIGVVCIGVASAVAAQKEEMAALAAKESDVKGILRGQTIPPGQEQLFDDFFDKYFLQQFASQTPSIHDNLPRVRKQLRIFFLTGKSGRAHERLNELTLQKMISILRTKDLDSVAKCNAALIIGELNEQEMNPVKLYAPAFKVLLVIVQTPKYFNDEVRMAALVGLERFAAAGAIPEDKRATIATMMLELLKQTTPPAGRTVAGHNWMRRSAAQILASLGSPGPDGGVVKALAAIVADSQARMTLRCEMAQNLGHLKFPAGAKVDYQALASLLGHQTVELCKKEIEEATAANQFLSASEDTRLHRQLTYIAHCALQGLEGPDARSGLVAAAAGDDSRSFVDSVRSQVKGLYASLEGSDTTDISDVKNRLAELEALLPPKPAPDSEVVAAKTEGKPAEPASQDDGARAAAGPPAGGGK